MTKRVDFDEIRDEPIEAKFGGEWYKLPADIPIAVLAALEAAEDDDGQPGKEFALVRQQVTKLFQVYQPELEQPPCGMRELFQVIPRLYWATESEAKPTRPKSRGGSKKPTRSKARKTTRSRSSTSRAR